MRNLLLAIMILGVAFFIGCEKENPVSAISNQGNTSLNKNSPYKSIPDPIMDSFYTSFQLSGDYSNNVRTSILEISGSSYVSGLGYSKIFSYSRINSNIQTGSLEITTTGGDKIIGSISGVIQKGTGSVLYFSGKYKFTSGTGNLFGTIGDGNYSGYFNQNGSTGRFILNGVIHLPEVIRIGRNSE